MSPLPARNSIRQLARPDARTAAAARSVIDAADAVAENYAEPGTTRFCGRRAERARGGSASYAELCEMLRACPLLRLTALALVDAHICRDHRLALATRPPRSNGCFAASPTSRSSWSQWSDWLTPSARRSVDGAVSTDEKFKRHSAWRSVHDLPSTTTPRRAQPCVIALLTNGPAVMAQTGARSACEGPDRRRVIRDAFRAGGRNFVAAARRQWTPVRAYASMIRSRRLQRAHLGAAEAARDTAGAGAKPTRDPGLPYKMARWTTNWRSPGWRRDRSRPPRLVNPATRRRTASGSAARWSHAR